MMLWLLVNSLLGLLALLFLGLNRDVPHRLRFHVCVLALYGWLVPWQLIAGLIPSSITVPNPAGSMPLTTLLADIPLPDLTAVTQTTAALSISPVQLLGAAFSIGIFLFLLTVLRHVFLLRALAASSKAYANAEIKLPEGFLETQIRNQFRPLQIPPIRLQRIVPGALTTGVFKPVIWVHESLLGNDALHAVLQHELTHIHQHDNAWLYLITCIEKLLWWNPLVIMLAGKARRLMELSCDAACQRDSAGYRSALNTLILTLSRKTVTSSNTNQALCAGIFKDANFNVERIRQLERRTIMKTRNYFSAGMLAISALFVVAGSSVYSQSDTQSPQVNESTAEPNQEDMEARKAKDLAEVNEKLAVMETKRGPAQTERELFERKMVAGLEVYADRLEQSWNELSESKKSLEARVQELEEQLRQQQ